MKRRTAPFFDERGSVLLISLVLIFVMTLLGLSLFDLGALENRMALSSAADLQAFQIATAGLERALKELQTDIHNETVSVVANPGWTNGSPACSPSPCVVDTFRSFPLANNSFGGGVFTVELMLISAAQAGDRGISGCLRDDSSSPPLCVNLIYVRSTGLLDGPPGYAASRTIQTLARASSTSPFAGGVTAGGTGPNPISGNVLIAGSIQIFGAEGGPSIQFTSSSSGQRNNYFDMASRTLNRLKPFVPAVDAVCPQVGVPCSSSDKVESLGAALRVQRPINSPAVVANPGNVGQTSSTATYGTPARPGKGPIDLVLVADGCAMPCADNYTFGGSGAVTVDGGDLTRPCTECLTSFPLLTDPVTINGTSYAHYACPISGCPGGGTEFFVNHTPIEAGSVPIVWTGCSPSCPPATTLGGLFGSANGLQEGTQSFTAAVTFNDPTSGAAVAGQVCWDRSTKTLEFRLGPCGTGPLANPSLAMLLRFDGPFRIDPGGGGAVQTINYRGAAIVLVRPTAPADLVKIDAIVQSACADDSVQCPRFYPNDDMLGILSFGNMEIGKDRSNLDRIMGLFYSQGTYTQQRGTKVVGNVTAVQFCFAGGCGDTASGSGTAVFQVPKDPRTLPSTLFPSGTTTWKVSSVPGFWRQCLASVPTGLCS